MKPYFETELGKLYNCDCLEFMQRMGDKSVDLVLTDPPYGIGIDGSKEHIKNNVQIRKKYEFMGWDNDIPDKECFKQISKVSKNQIICGANYFNEYLEQGKKGWIIWDKGQRGLTMSDCEILYTSFNKPTRIITVHRAHLWKEKPRHPTQKPMMLFHNIINTLSEKNNLIFDPFLGSGTTAVACEKLGRKWIGCEISEKYCEIAAKRIDNEARQGKLFI